MSISSVIIWLLVLGYLAIYVGSRKYLEWFQDANMQEATPRFSEDGTPIPNQNAAAMPEIQSSAEPADEYEVSAVFQNQGSKQASQQQISDAMTRYPLDWSVQGPNSEYFQANQIQYTSDTNYATQPAPFKPQETGSPVPESQEEEEQKILKTYQPKSSKDLLTYSVDDVKNLLDKVYDKKGLIPVIQKSKQGPNVWEITEIKEKNPKIVWEDDAEKSTRQAMDMRGEEKIQVPYTASDVAAVVNPFLNPRERVGKGPYPTQQWTPGVDRMFTPSYPIPAWN